MEKARVPVVNYYETFLQMAQAVKHPAFNPDCASELANAYSSPRYGLFGIQNYKVREPK